MGFRISMCIWHMYITLTVICNFLAPISDAVDAPRYRAGSATSTHSCDQIRGVPGSLRSASGIGPHGLDFFYQKYTEAYGIPVLGK